MPLYAWLVAVALVLLLSTLLLMAIRIQVSLGRAPRPPVESAVQGRIRETREGMQRQTDALQQELEALRHGAREGPRR